MLFDFESARTHGIAIAGSDSQVVEFGRVPLEWLLAAADRVLAQWEGYEYFRQPHMAALQAARAWRLATDGTLTSKLSAGRWALQRWPNPDLLAQALARQRGKCEALVDEPQARALLAHARGAIPSRIGHPPQDR